VSNQERKAKCCFVIMIVKFVEGLWRNCLSLSSILKKRANIVSDSSNMILSKSKLNFKFHKIESSRLVGVKLRVEVGTALVTGLSQVKVDINVLSRRLGQPVKLLPRTLVYFWGLQVTEKIEICAEFCSFHCC
jgi:hypothetical protein